MTLNIKIGLLSLEISVTTWCHRMSAGNISVRQSTNLGEEWVELLVGVVVATLREVGLNLLADLLLVQVPRVVVVRTRPRRRVRCSYTQTHQRQSSSRLTDCAALISYLFKKVSQYFTNSSISYVVLVLHHFHTQIQLFANVFEKLIVGIIVIIRKKQNLQILRPPEQVRFAGLFKTWHISKCAIPR